MNRHSSASAFPCIAGYLECPGGIPTKTLLRSAGTSLKIDAQLCSFTWSLYMAWKHVDPVPILLSNEHVSLLVERTTSDLLAFIHKLFLPTSFLCFLSKRKQERISFFSRAMLEMQAKYKYSFLRAPFLKTLSALPTECQLRATSATLLEVTSYLRAG